MTDARRYEIVDGHTGAVVARATGAKRARGMAERRNQEYGAHRYYAVLVRSDKQ